MSTPTVSRIPHRMPDPGEWERMVRDAIFNADHDGTCKELWDRAHRSEWPHPNAPMKVAKKIAKKLADDERHIKRWRNDWYRWTGSHYPLIDDEYLYGILYNLIGENAGYLDDGEWKPWNADDHKLSKAGHALKAEVAIDPVFESPCWIDGTEERLIPFTNGLLRTSDREFLEHTSEYFNRFVRPFDYDKNAPRPVPWIEFLEMILPGDPDAQKMLQEWFGYAISGRRDLHKMLMMIGLTRSGKGTIARILEAIIGHENCVGALASTMTKYDFGLEPLISKELCVFPDERLSSVNAKKFVDLLLRITGDDIITIPKKNKSAWTGHLPTRLMFMSNEVPTLPDASGAIVGRMLMLDTPESFLDKEIWDFEKGLMTVIPGIINWGLDGLDELTSRGRFIKPASHENLIEQLRGSASSHFLFVDEMCDLDVDDPKKKTLDSFESTEDLYKGWKHFCEVNGYSPGNRETFARKLVAALGKKITRTRSGGRGEQVWGYAGIALKPETRRTLGMSGVVIRRARPVVQR